MTSEEQIALAEEVRERLATLKQALRKKYPQSTQQVTNPSLRGEAKNVGEMWATKLANSSLIGNAMESENYASLSVEFERLYTLGEKSAKRSTYDETFLAINRLLTGPVVLSMKAAAAKQSAAPSILTKAEAPLIVKDKLPTAFVGHSFDDDDRYVTKSVIETLQAIGVETFTGEKPRAEKISEKVKSLIESQEIFVGVFTRRDKLHGRDRWVTTQWVIEEKAYAIAKKRELILLWEDGVVSIGGMHGDQEYISFDRKDMSPMIIRLLQMFDLRTGGLR